MTLIREELFIDGEWVAPQGGATSEVIEASTGQVFGAAAMASSADIDRAVAAARAALTGPWAALSPSERRSEEHTSELQSLMRISYAVFCLKKKNKKYAHQSK